MKTNKVPLSLMPSDSHIVEEDKVLDTITKRTDEKAQKALTHYAYSLTATIITVMHRGAAVVEFCIEGNVYRHEASTTEVLQDKHEGKECLITFNKGEIAKPVITGILQTQEEEPLILSCEEGIVLECGETRIVLDVEGTLDLKALHINSQAYGPYRIKGGSVKIN